MQTPPIVLYQTEHVAVGIVQHPRTDLWVSWLWEDPYFWYLMGDEQEEAIACAEACFAVFERAGMRRAEETSSAINEIVWHMATMILRIAQERQPEREKTSIPTDPATAD
jgi:hypothetical protein